MAAPQKWDCGVLESNSNFFYQDSAVLIKVGGRDFRVSRSRLAAVSPQFQQAFQFAGAHPDSEPVELHNDPEDFEYFLWFVHVNPLQLEQYNARVSKPEKFRHWLGIAVIAHMYEASDISESCVTKIFAALERADRAFSVEPFMMCKLYRLTIRHAEPVSAGSLSLLDRTRRIWADLLYASKDPVQWLLAARAPEVEDTYLQALAYYYIYSKGPKSEDARLTGEDGQRLLIGAFNLAGQGHHPHNQTGVRPLFPPRQPPQPYGGGLVTNVPFHNHFGGAMVTPMPSGTMGVPMFGGAMGALVPRQVAPWTPRYANELLKQTDTLWDTFTLPPWRLTDVPQPVA